METTMEEKPKQKRVASSRAKSSETEINQIREGINAVWAMGGSGLGFMAISQTETNPDLAKRLAFDGEHIMKQGPVLTETIIKACKENAEMRKVFLNLVSGGIYGELLFNMVMLIVPILNNHKAIPKAVSMPYERFMGSSDNETVVNTENGTNNTYNTYN